MDPLSILGAVATASKLMEMTVKIAKDLNDIRKRYAGVADTLVAIENECTTVSAAVRILRDWMRDTLKDEVDERHQDLLTALKAFQPSIKALNDEVTRICATASTDSRFGSLALSRKKKLKFLWNEDTMKMYLENVRWQAMNLHFLLSATKFSVPESTEKIRQVAIATSVRFPPLDDKDRATIAPSTFGGTTMDDKSFPGLDDILVNSSSYRATLERANNILRANQSSTSEINLVSPRIEDEFSIAESTSTRVEATILPTRTYDKEATVDSDLTRLASSSTYSQGGNSSVVTPSTKDSSAQSDLKTENEVSSKTATKNMIELEANDESKTVELSDNEDDDDIWDYGQIGFDLLETSVSQGHELFHRGFWNESEPLFLRSLELFQGSDVKYVTLASGLKLSYEEVEGELALAYCYQAKWEEAQKLLVPFAEPFLSKEGNLNSTPSENDLVFLHNLAICQLRLSQLRMAEKVCGVALKGRRTIFGKGHPLYQESLSLLVQIVERRGNIPRAVAFASLLPKDSIYHTDTKERAQSIIKSLGHDMGSADFTVTECLRSAISKDKLDAVELLLAQVDASPNSRDPDGKTTLHLAAIRKEDGIIKAVLRSKDIRLDVQDKDGMTPLMYAVKESVEANVRALLAKPEIIESLNGQDSLGKTALYHAAEVGEGEIMKLMLNFNHQDIRINLSTKEAMTPLMIAVDKNHTIAVRRLLLREDISVNQQNHLGKTALSIACQRGFSSVTKLLLEHPDIALNIPDTKLWTALHHAIYERHTTIAKLLLEEKDIDINIKNEISTPLHLACVNGMTEIAKVLVERPELEVNKESIRGWTPLHSACAAKPENADVVAYLLQRKEIKVNLTSDRDWSPLNNAANNGYSKIVRLLLERNDVDVNSASNTGQTALYSAASNNHTGVVRLLLQYAGVDVNQPVDSGWTPLNVACGDSSFETVKVLLEDPRVDVNRRNNDGYTPLCTNSSKKRNDISTLLLARPDIDINSASNDGWTPINRAAEGGNTELVEMLLKRQEINFEAPTAYLATPLYSAARYGHSDVVKALLARDGINVNRVQKNNWSPLNTSSSRGFTEVVRLLVARPDVNMNLKDSSGMTALCNAATNGHLEVVKLLLGRKDTDVNSVTEKGWCALACAANAGHYSIVELLAGAAGIDLALGEAKDVSAMQCAVKKGHTKIVEYLKTRLPGP